MTIYIGIFLTLIILSLVEMFTDNKKIVFISAGLLFFVAGLRYYTGYDFESYKEYYYISNSFSQLIDGSVRLERGYLFLSIIFSQMGFTYYTFVLFFSGLSISVLTGFIYKNFKYPSLFLMYYFARFFLARDMGQVRGGFAGVILLFAIPYVQKKQFLKFLAIVFLASLFHISAWVFLLVYILNELIDKVTFKNTLILLSCALFCGVILQINSLYLWAVPEFARSYFVSPYYTDGPWLLYPILWLQLIILFSSLFIINHKTRDEKVNLLMKIYLIAPCVLIASGRLWTVGGRLSGFFILVEGMLLPYLFFNFSKYKLLNLIGIIGFTTAIFLLIFLAGDMLQEYVPYRTIFH